MAESTLTSVVKIPLEVGLSQASTVDGQSRICNWLYNQLLSRANALKETYRQTQDSQIGKVLYTERGLRNLVPEMKKDHPFLCVVHSSPLKNVALRLSESIQTYQKSRKGKRKGKNSGWPRFRSWSRNWFSLLYDEPNKGFKLEGNTLTLSLGMGRERDQRYVNVTLESSQALQGKVIRSLRIVKQLGQFFAVFTVQTPMPVKKPIKTAVALDPNHKNLAYGVGTDSEAVEIAAPSWLKQIDRRIDEVSSKRDRCKRKSQKIPRTNGEETTTNSYFWKPSRRWRKFDRLMEKLRRKRRDQTKTFLFTIAQKLYRQYDLVAIGNYTPDGTGESTAMRRAMNNQSLIGRFKEVLSWVASKSGKFFYEYDERGTTRTCNECDYILSDGLSPDKRTWCCPGCDRLHIRDENSAIIGLKRVLRDFHLEYLVPGSGPVSPKKRWAWRALPSGVSTTPRGPCSDLFTAPRNLNGSVVAPDQNSLIRFAQV